MHGPVSVVKGGWVVGGVVGVLAGVAVVVGAHQTAGHPLAVGGAGAGAAGGAAGGGVGLGVGNVGDPVTVLGRVDTFDRPDSASDLGAMGGGHGRWQPVAGRWGIAGGEAFVAGPVPGPANGPLPGRDLAVVRMVPGDSALQLRVAKVVEGAGLVFRYRDQRNFWAVVAVPDFATWALVKVTDGRQVAIANTGFSRLDDGTVLGVRSFGDTLDVVLGGRVARTVVDGSFRDGPMAGMIAAGPDAAGARFDDFRIEDRR